MTRVSDSWSFCSKNRINNTQQSLASGERQKIMKQHVASVINYPFRMPLYCDNGKGTVHKSFNDVVACTADRDQVFTRAVHRLMMGGVYQSAVPVELVEEVRVR